MVQFGRPSLVHFRRHIPVQLRPSLDSSGLALKGPGPHSHGRLQAR